jgi:hypothetical protein
MNGLSRKKSRHRVQKHIGHINIERRGNSLVVVVIVQVFLEPALIISRGVESVFRFIVRGSSKKHQRAMDHYDLLPVHILQEVLHAVYEAAVRPELQFVHDVVDRYQIANVERHVVAEMLGRGIEIRDVHASAMPRSHR